MAKKIIKKLAKKPVIKKEKIDKKPKLLKADSIDLIVKISNLRALFKKLSVAISTEPTRYYLNSILFEKKGNEINFVATDGHKMVVIDAKDNRDYMIGGFEVYEDFSFIIPRAAVTDFIKPHGTKTTTCRININKENISFNYGDLTKTYKMVDCTYPDWRMVMPTKFNPYTCFNAKYMRQLCTVLGDKEEVILQANPENGGAASNPTVVTNGGGCKFIIMPRRF